MWFDACLTTCPTCSITCKYYLCVAWFSCVSTTKNSKHPQQIIDACVSHVWLNLHVRQCIFHVFQSFARGQNSMFVICCEGRLYNENMKSSNNITRCICRVWWYLHAFQCNVLPCFELVVIIPCFCQKHPNSLCGLTCMSCFLNWFTCMLKYICKKYIVMLLAIRRLLNLCHTCCGKTFNLCCVMFLCCCQEHHEFAPCL